VETQIRMSRLRLLGRVLLHGSAELAFIIDAEGSWLQQLLSDCQWLDQLGVAYGLPDAREVPSAWLSMIRADPGKWRRMIRAAGSLAGAELPPASSRVGTQPPPPPLDSQGVPLDAAFCYECEQSFVSTRALATHCRRAHGIQGRAFDACHGTHCLRCLVEHHTRTRLLQHLRQADECRSRILEHVERPSSDAVSAMLQAERTRATAARRASLPPHALPACRLAGPLARWAI